MPGPWRCCGSFWGGVIFRVSDPPLPAPGVPAQPCTYSPAVQMWVLVSVGTDSGEV